MLLRAIEQLKQVKSGGEEGLWSDYIIHGTHTLYVLMTLVFNALLIHSFSPNSMILGTMVPIPKNKKKSLCDSNNYRAIALSSVIGKTLDLVILIDEGHLLTSSNLQFGFKSGLFTTHCTFCLNETINYYNYKR